MLTHLVIKNFQSHARTELNLHPGVNVIVGGSDSGKSAVLRALLWAVTNKPSGDSFRSTWAVKDATAVEVEFSDGVRVLRSKKGANGNHYMQFIGNEWVEFKAFGQDVPADLVAAMQMDHINVQRQLDTPFFIGENPGERGKILNRIVNLEPIDAAITKINGELLRLKESHRTLIDTTTKQEADLATLGDVDDLAHTADLLLALERDYERQDTGVVALSKTLEALDVAYEQLHAVSELAKLQDTITELEAFSASLTARERQEGILAVLLSEIGKTQAALETKTKVAKLTNKITELDALEVKMAGLGETQTSLAAIIRQIYDTQIALGNIEERIEYMEGQFHKLMPNECPLCGQEIQK